MIHLLRHARTAVQLANEASSTLAQCARQGSSSRYSSSPVCLTATPPLLSPQVGGYFQSGHGLTPGGNAVSTYKILVTGAGGQVGAELVPYLRQQVGENNVIASDVRSSRGEQGQFTYCDVTDKDNLARIVLENRVTHVVHLATLLSAVGEKNPQLALRVNTLGIQNVLDVAASNHVSVFAPSTIAVFGASTPKDMTPDDTVCEPSTMYGITKVHQELLGKYYADKFGVDFRSLRYPGIISSHTLPGGGTTDYAVEMYMAAVVNQPYTCFIHKETHLPMMYMNDCLRATWQLMTAPREKLKRCTYNITAMSFTPTELEASIRATACPTFEVSYVPDYRQDIASTWPGSINDEPARTDWDWKPAFDLTGMTQDMMTQLLIKHKDLPDSCDVDASSPKASVATATPSPAVASA